MTLPADGHTHTEWSWDTYAGSMEGSCQRAVELGLPAIAFTEHVDATPLLISPELESRLHPEVQKLVVDGWLRVPELDLAGYLAGVERCRDRFPQLRILSGVELGEPHRHEQLVRDLLAGGGLDRRLGSLHALPGAGGFQFVDEGYDTRDPHDVIRDYLAEVLRMVEQCDAFAVLAHIDYPVRYWPDRAGPYRPGDFEAELRAVLKALAGSGRALEVNTRVPLHAEVVRWWYEVGGEAVCFGSDAHEPSHVAFGFADAAAMAESVGFRPGRHPYDFWLRGS